MPAPTRDRLARPVDISSLYTGAARRVNLIVDEPGLLWSRLSPNPNPNPNPTISSTHSGSGRSLIGGRGSGSGSIRRGNRENRAVARVRGRGSPLPYWYPRTPLRDITAVVRAIERRRVEQNDDQTAVAPRQETAAPVPSIARIDQEIDASTPIPIISRKPQISPFVPIYNENTPGAEFITPQKRLLDSIEKVREAWLEEKRKLEKTPSAKKAERQKKIKTLMSMR